MKMHPSDPDIETIVARIERDELDLQPDFQRGEVWSEVKRQRLIDSILRGWHIPPIHVLGIEGSPREEVLDGQQRLAAIRDFMRGAITVNGETPPHDPAIAALEGQTYVQLPADIRKRFNRFTLRQFTLTDYAPAEPAELFYRLNQLTALTPAEQRNAFVGPAREQVKSLTAVLYDSGVDKEFVGFSNSRMAYDEVVARLALAASNRSILIKITAADLAEVYRSPRGFDDEAVNRCAGAIQLFGASREYVEDAIRLNKATMFTWIWFLLGAIGWGTRGLNPNIIGHFISAFEVTRQHRLRGDEHPAFRRYGKAQKRIMYMLLEFYDDRATSRVGDVFSVVFRDLVIWSFFALFAQEESRTWPSNIRGPINDFLKAAEMGPEELIDFSNRLITHEAWGSIP
jgi:hypothetical protein